MFKGLSFNYNDQEFYLFSTIVFQNYGEAGKFYSDFKYICIRFLFFEILFTFDNK